MTKPFDGLTDYVATEAERERVAATMYQTDPALSAAIVPEYRPEWTETDLARYRSDGYVAMDGIVPLEAVDAAQSALSDLVHRRVGNDLVFFQEEPYYTSGGADPRAEDRELRVRAIRSFCQADERLAAVASHLRIRRLLDQLIGPGHRMIQDTALLKPPFHGAEKPWHQDGAYFDQTPLDEVIGVWIALDAATIDNGCMQVIPGTHRDGPAQHYHVRDCQLDDRRVAVDRAVVVPLRPGGALFFSALLHHGTPPNRGGERRRAVQFHYAAGRCTQMSIEEHAALFDDGGAYAGCRDWDLPAGMSRARIAI